MENYRDDLLKVISSRLKEEAENAASKVLDFEGFYTLPNGEMLEWGVYMDFDIEGSEVLAVSLSNDDHQLEEWISEKMMPLAWELYDQIVEHLREDEEYWLEYDRGIKEHYDRMLAEWPAGVIPH